VRKKGAKLTSPCPKEKREKTPREGRERKKGLLFLMTTEKNACPLVLINSN